MEQIVIYKTDGTTLPLASYGRATTIESATQTVKLLGDDTVSVVITSAYKHDFNIGDYCIIYGKKYTLNRLPKVQKSGAFEFQYDLEFEGIQYDMSRVTFDLTVDTTNNQLADVSAESLTGNLKRFGDVLISNMCRVFPNKWLLGEYPTTSEDTTLTFSEGTNCLTALQTLCSEFDTEFEIVRDESTDVHTLNFKKVGKTFPYTFEYGKNRGLYSMTRENVSSENIVTRLKVYGSTENITYKYRARRLCLPGKKKQESYIEDAAAVAKYGIWEGTKVFDDIKPTWTGHVQKVVEGSVVQFVDDTMFDLNALNDDGSTKYLIAGSSAMVHFNTGNLAGYEFEVSAYDHATHTFTLKAEQDERGNVFPSETSAAFQFKGKTDTYAGDEYKLINICVPSEYEASAEAELEAKGQEYYKEKCQPRVQYGLSITESFLASKVEKYEDKNIVWAGDYIPVKDGDIGVDKTVRVESIKRDLLKDFSYTLTISDIEITPSITVRVLQELGEHENAISLNNLADPARARANWRTSREVLGMVFDTEGDYYSEKIKPLSIETTMLAVGAKSQQFQLRDIIFMPNYNGNENSFYSSEGYLDHFAIDDSATRTWQLGEDFSTGLTSGQAYYIYAKCPTNDIAGKIVLSDEAIAVEQVAGYYHFLIGILNSVDSTSTSSTTKARQVSLTYGSTTVNGRFIRTGKISSTDGSCYFDLDNNEIGGAVSFTANDGTTKNVSDLDARADEAKDYINNTLPSELQALQDQIDGKLEQYFYETDPAPTYSSPTDTPKLPNSEWTTTAECEKHNGDLYYNTSSGKVWRFVKKQSLSISYFCWSELEDTEAAKALELATEALDTAKGKAQIFTATPTPPYAVGDLWVQGSTGDIMRCQTARESGSYAASDWVKASKYTDDAAFTTFVNGQYATDLTALQGQVDGKVESWFQTSDPSAQWYDDDKKAKHVGDMWYNSSTMQLKRYCATTTSSGTTYSWQTLQDERAVAAYQAASAAQDTADKKRQVFVATPTPPYAVGDLWLTGGKEDGTLRRCIAAKTSSEAYSADDWVEAVYYDNTKTTVDGGIVTSGTVQLVSSLSESIVAGITGGGEETSATTDAQKVRIWAGASRENRYTAPFRVTQNGDCYMSNATIEGDSTVKGTVYATAGEFNGTVKICGGKILLNTDGSGRLANGRMTWDANGNITMNNVTANNGTFRGSIKATGGFAFGTQYITENSAFIDESSSYVKINIKGQTYVVENYNMYLPPTPNVGAQIIIRSCCPYAFYLVGKTKLWGYYIKSISAGDTYIGEDEGEFYSDKILFGTRKIYIAIFDGEYWNILRGLER